MITSTSNPRIRQVIQWQTKAKERRKDGVFVVEGIKMYEEAPDEWLRETYVSTGFLERIGARKTAGEATWQNPDGSMEAAVWNRLQTKGYEEVSDEVFAKMSDTKTPQGILAVLDQPRYDLQEILQCSRESSVEKRQPLFLVLENLQDPGNLGTIMRTGEGAGITAVIMSASTVDIFNPKVIRSTMGSIYRVPFIYEESLPEVMAVLHEAGVKTYAAHLDGKDYYDSFSFEGPTAFLIGNEGNGLTRELADMASFYIKIPMEGKLESLNAGVASALLVYEAHRQRSASSMRHG